MASLEEIEFLHDTAVLERAMLDAKAAAQAAPDDEAAQEAFRAAKDAVRAHRAHWRGIREFIRATGEAADAPGDAVAAPATHGVGVSAKIGG